MNAFGMDAEEVAALLDGRLSERERSAVLARLAASPEAMDILADAAAVLGESVGNERATTSAETPRREKSLRSWRNATWIGIAAVLVIAVSTPLLLRRMRHAGAASSGYAVLLAPDDVHWKYLPIPWSVVRGPEASLGPTTLAARVGVRLTDLERSVRGGDSTSAGAASEIASMLEGTPAAGPIAEDFRRIADEAGRPSAELLPRFTTARAAALRVVDRDVADFASWLEAARMAAASHDDRFFHARDTRQLLDRAAAMRELPAPARSGVERLRRASSLPSIGSWSELARDIEATLRILTA